MSKLKLLQQTTKSIDNQILSNNFPFKLSFYSHYLFKIFNFKNPIKFPKSKFKFQNVILNTRENTIDFWACLESYEPDLTYFLIEILKDHKGSFIDVGGHIGRFTVLMAKNGWQVTTFEPIKNNYDMIISNLKENNCLSNATVNQLGLGDKNQTETIYFNSTELGESSLVYSTDKKEQSEIKIIRFDDYISDKTFLKPCILKMDIEGNEENAINGMKNFISKEKPIIILELWEDNEKNISNFLKSKGYNRIHIFWFIEQEHSFFREKMHKFYHSKNVNYEYE